MGSGGHLADGALDAELTALRARAYGVDADIDADPVALARLAELEELHAAVALQVPAGSAEPGSGVTGSPAGSGSAAGAAGASGDGGGAELRWWRRTRAGAILAGAVVATAATLAVVAWMAWTAPRATATLRPTGAAPSEQVLRLADYARRQLVMESTLRAFEPVLDLEVYSARSVIGNSCLLVFEPASDDLLGVGCAPPPAQPQVEIYDVPVAWEEEWTDRFPSGTMVRFVLTGDAVDVWVYEGGSIGDAATAGYSG